MRTKEKIIFRISGRIPILQVVVLLLFGCVSMYLATQINVGTYEGFESQVTQNGQAYVLVVPAEHEQVLDESVEISWSFEQLIGRKYPLARNVANGETLYVMNTDLLGDEDRTQLNAKGATVYVDCKKNRHPLFEAGGNNE